MEFYRDGLAIKSEVLCRLKESGVALPDKYTLKVDCRGSLIDIIVVDTSTAKCAFKTTVCVDLNTKSVRIEGVYTPFEFKIELFDAIRKVFSVPLSQLCEPSSTSTAPVTQQSTEEVSELSDYVKVCSIDTDFLSVFKNILGTFKDNFKFTKSCNGFTDVLAHNSSIGLAKKLVEVSKSTLISMYRACLESAIEVYGDEKLPKARQTVTLSSPEKRIASTVEGYYIATEGALPNNVKLRACVSLTGTSVHLIDFNREVTLTAKISQASTISVSASEYTNLIPFCRAVSLAFDKSVVATFEDGVKITVEPPDSALKPSWVEVGCIDIDLYDAFIKFANSKGFLSTSHANNIGVGDSVFGANIIDSKAYICAPYQDYRSVLKCLLEYRSTVLSEFDTKDIII
jgi:hypothetical protein